MDLTSLKLRPCARALTPLVPAWLCAVADGHPAPCVVADLASGIVELDLPEQAARALARWLGEPRPTVARLQQVFSLRGHPEVPRFLERAARTSSVAPSVASSVALLSAGVALGCRDTAEALVDAHRLPRPDDLTSCAKALFADTPPPALPHPMQLVDGVLLLSGLPDAPIPLLRGLAASLSLSMKEKLRILGSLEGLSERQRDHLQRTFQEERKKFRELDEKHHRALRKLVVEHAVDWVRIHEHLRNTDGSFSRAEEKVR